MIENSRRERGREGERKYRSSLGTARQITPALQQLSWATVFPGWVLDSDEFQGPHGTHCLDVWTLRCVITNPEKACSVRKRTLLLPLHWASLEEADALSCCRWACQSEQKEHGIGWALCRPRQRRYLGTKRPNVSSSVFQKIQKHHYIHLYLYLYTSTSRTSRGGNFREVL